MFFEEANSSFLSFEVPRSSLTSACIIPNEKSATLRDNLSTLFVSLYSPDGPPATIRVDPAPSFRALKNDPALLTLGITLEIGRAKNINKNPVAEKAVAEVEEELRRQAPNGEPITQLRLSIAISRLNTAVARTLIGGGGCSFIYSCSARLVSFEIKFKFINLKRN